MSQLLRTRLPFALILVLLFSIFVYSYKIKKPQEIRVGLGAIAGDVNGDGIVNITDFQLLSNSFGKFQGQSGFNANADFNGDNTVDILDFQILSNNFGRVGSITNTPTPTTTLIPSPTPASIKHLQAFPGAQGFGSQTPGGRGGAILFVTNLNDSGPGSLRAALTASGPRTVIFKTGGTINLSSTITITNPYLTIAGQTAPGDGILIRGPNAPESINAGPTIFEIVTHDVIIRGLRMREVNRATIGLYADPNGSIYNIIIDHNSLSWSTDTIADIWYNPHDITYSWDIISEAVGTDHSMGMLIGGLDTCGTPGYNFSIHHNLFAQNNDRNPLIQSQIGSPELINNVIYNYYWYGIRTFSEAAIIGNYLIAGNNTVSPQGIFLQNRGSCPTLQPGSIYVSHNIGPGRLTDTGDDASAVYEGFLTYGTRTAPTWLSGMTADDVSTIKSKVLSAVGAIVPYRDSVDSRVINDVMKGTGKPITDPTSVGGWPTLSPGTYPADTDGDGIPDSWETSHGLDPNNASDANKVNSDGYTNIEKYINSFYP